MANQIIYINIAEYNISLSIIGKFISLGLLFYLRIINSLRIYRSHIWRPVVAPNGYPLQCGHSDIV